jgi:hypothetical protein
MMRLLNEFRERLPELTQAAQLTLDEADAYRGYRNFMDLLSGFGDAVRNVGK